MVSRKLFENFWREYLNDSYNPTVQINKINLVSFGVFRKYIILDGFRRNSYYDQWCKKTLDFEKGIQLFFGIENQIHYRIFESWDAVKDYYINSITKLKQKLENKNENN